jgi:hypothetical protein
LNQIFGGTILIKNFKGKRRVKQYICFTLPLIIFFLSCISYAKGTERDSIDHFRFSSRAYKIPAPKVKFYFSDTSDRSDLYKRVSNIKFSGYFRSFLQFRNLPVRYPDVPSQHQLAINGYDLTNRTLTGFPDPFLLITAEGNPTSQSYLKVTYAFEDLLYNNLKDKSGTIPENNKRGSPFRLMQFEASTSTKFGDFKMIAGGPLIWYRLSQFTMWSYQYRSDMFERLPWETSGTSFSRYNRYYADNYYANGAMQWGNTGFQGFILEGNALPKGFGIKLLYGKTDNTAGFQTAFTGTTKNMGGGRIEKSVGEKSKLGANFFTQAGYTNNVANFKIIQQIITGDFRADINGFNFYIEAGAGRYQDSIVQRTTTVSVDSATTRQLNTGEIEGINYNWKPALNVEIGFTNQMVKIPISIQGYYIDKSVVNINSAVLNSANPHARPDLATARSSNDITTFQGAITDLGQMTNNRWGVNLKHENNYGKLKVILGGGVGQEIENLFNMIYFQHRANAYVRSRFAFYEGTAGPYGRIKSIFRRTYEMIRITDVNPDYKKSYNTLDLQLKLKLSLFQKDFVLTNYNNYNSVQDKLQALPQFKSNAFVRTFYEEFMGFYSISSKISLLGFVSYEKILGNNRTELADENGDLITDFNGSPVSDPNGKPISQQDFGLGAGFDYNFTKNAGLYLRHRWFHHKDFNFIRDRFTGQESSLEVKVFF